MDNLQFIQCIYYGKNLYSDSMTQEQLDVLHIESGIEGIISKMIEENRIVFLTGNPGDGKTFIIKYQEDKLNDAYKVPDLNSIDLDSDKGKELVENLYKCYCENKPAIIAANEFPFHALAIRLKHEHPDMYEELNNVRNNILHIGYTSFNLKKICIIDLNERNLLDPSCNVVGIILTKFTQMLSLYRNTNIVLAHNIDALSDQNIQAQIGKIFENISLTGQHFVIRDILLSIANILVKCTDPDIEGSGFYYDALFEGNNDVMNYASQFDPIRLSCPTLDERIWNGDMKDGWILGEPEKWPINVTSEEGGVEAATELFKSIKRRFFFENIYAKELAGLQPLDFNECVSVFMKIKQDNKIIKRMIIGSMNRIFLSSDKETEKLRVWTSHNYDLSRNIAAAVSTRYIDIDDLELVYPEPVDWLKDMEYIPSKIILFYKKKPDCRLDIDVEFLRRLIMIKNGYPSSLLSEQYEQAIIQFAKRMESLEACKDYSDGEILVCNRKTGESHKIYVDNAKYSLGIGSEVGFSWQ